MCLIEDVSCDAEWLRFRSLTVNTLNCNSQRSCDQTTFFFFFKSAIQNSLQNKAWLSKTTSFNCKSQFQSYPLKIRSWKVEVIQVDYFKLMVECRGQCKDTSSGVSLIRNLANSRILCIYQPTQLSITRWST